MRLSRIALTPILLLALCFTSTARAEKTSLSYVTWNADFGYIMAAIDKGYFAEEGLDVDLTSAGGGVAVPAVISGSLDFTGSGSSAISAILKGAHMKVVLVGQDRPGWQLWSVRPELKTVADLKDQPVAVISRGDSGEIALRYLLKKHNLPRDYFAFTPMGNGTARLAAISSGSVPAGIMVWGEVEKLKTSGGLEHGHLISNLTQEVRMPFNGLATSDKLIAEKPDLVLRMVRGAAEGPDLCPYLSYASDRIDHTLRQDRRKRRGIGLRSYPRRYRARGHSACQCSERGNRAAQRDGGCATRATNEAGSDLRFRAGAQSAHRP
jgi:ABC-type nitrate/sulfonate/bicarbonate transport system substrate-binding protein